MIISPSLLSMDFSKFKESIDILNENVKWLHYDVMDGHFVPNITFGQDILKTVRKNSPLMLDVHLMISDPFYYLESFVKAGADIITFHYEALDDIQACESLIDEIHSYYLKAGISIKPNTPIETILPLLKKADLVLVMSVEPGFGGQKFMESSLSKIEKLNEYRINNSMNYVIEVDGGINDTNVSLVEKAGADAVVAGSYVFNGDIQHNINTLKHSKQ